MKLLPTFAVKDKQQEELTRKILRTQEINKLAQEADLNLARAQAEFSSTMARNQAKWALEEEEHAERIQSMSQEIQSLEHRKKEALIPIQMYKDEADKILAEAQNIMERAKEKEEQADYLQEKLEEKLTEVADREQFLQDSEKRLDNIKQGITSQQEQTTRSAEALVEKMTQFHMKQQDEESSILKRKEELAMAEISFNAKLLKYERDLKALHSWEQELKSERDALYREYERRM